MNAMYGTKYVVLSELVIPWLHLYHRASPCLMVFFIILFSYYLLN